MEPNSEARKSIWRYVVEWGIVPLAMGLILAGIVIYNERSDAATPAPTSATFPRRCVPPDATMTCDQYAQSWGDTKARQFRRGKLGTAQGITLPRRWRRAFNRWAANHPQAETRLERRGDGHWWDWPLESLMCTPMAGSGYRIACDAANRHHRQYVKGVVRISVTCGGLAAVGALAGGGAVGAGKGAGACLWGMLALKVFSSNGWLHWRAPAQRGLPWSQIDAAYKIPGPLW